MANYEATRYDFDGANLTGIEGVNTGIVVPWGSASIPSGFLLCDGTSYATASYTALFAVIAYTYGGSGANFNVPDLRDRTIVGVSSANSKTLAQAIGANTVTPTGNIAGSTGATTLNTCQIPSHSHSMRALGEGGNQVRVLLLIQEVGTQVQQGVVNHMTILYRLTLQVPLTLCYNLD
jgi:microcystin-dependent protein